MTSDISTQSLDNLKKQIPPNILELTYFIMSQDFELALVGGAIRDFLLFGQLPKDCDDFDFEIRHKVHLLDDEWIKKLRKLQTLIVKKFQDIKIENLEFGIFKMTLRNGEHCEIAPARTENFIKGDYRHKNFTATLVSDLSLKLSVERRDLTINSMMITFDKNYNLKLEDPTGFGLSDIREKILRPVSKDFVKDPVRLLRAVRFQQQYHFKYSVDFLKMLKEFNLSQVTPYYFLNEGLRCDFFTWSDELKKILPANFALPEFMKDFFAFLNEKTILKVGVEVKSEAALVFYAFYHFDIPSDIMEFVPLKKRLRQKLLKLSDLLKSKNNKEASRKIFDSLPSDVKKSLQKIEGLL